MASILPPYTAAIAVRNSLSIDSFDFTQVLLVKEANITCVIPGDASNNKVEVRMSIASAEGDGTPATIAPAQEFPGVGTPVDMYPAYDDEYDGSEFVEGNKVRVTLYSVGGIKRQLANGDQLVTIGT